MKNSHPSMQNSNIPVTISDTEAGTESLVWSVWEPFERMARTNEIRIITKALSWESHATVIDVNPTPFATPL